jgi:hypothetical protein
VDRWVQAQTMAAFSMVMAAARLDLAFEKEAPERSSGAFKPH